MHDVAVVGAGPGGLFAAQLLASNGFRVLVLEEHSAVGVPVHCTGIIGAGVCAEFQLPTDAVLNTLESVSFYSPEGRKVSFQPDRAEAVVLDRHRFDQLFLDRTRSAGVEILLGTRVRDIEVGAGSVTIQTSDGPVPARTGILACGAHYALQRRLGMGVPEHFLNTAQVEIPCDHLHDVEVYVGSNVAPKGFAWAVPVKRGDRGSVRVGLMCQGSATEPFKSFLVRMRERWSATEAVEPRLKMLPLGPIPRTVTDRVLAIGDAAGIVKPVTGGGIYFTLLTAQLAAAVLAKALHDDALEAANLQSYDQAWRARLGQEIEAQSAMRRILDTLDDARIESFFHLAQTDGIIPLVRRTAQFNAHRDFIVALFKHPMARAILTSRLQGSLEKLLPR